MTRWVTGPGLGEGRAGLRAWAVSPMSGECREREGLGGRGG